MNSQLNSFQQFVSENKGKMITFRYNDIEFTKFVVDICGDYFTAKSKETDDKIDAFFYFSECKIAEKKHPLIDILKNHRAVVLHFTNGKSSMFKYGYYGKNMLNGHCLTTYHPVGFHIESIKEVWTVINSNHTKIWENIFDENKQQYKLIQEHAEKFLKIEYGLLVYAPNSANKFISELLAIKDSDFSLEKLNKVRATFHELRDELIQKMFPIVKTNTSFQDFIKKFIEYTLLIAVSSHDKDNAKNVLKKLDKVINRQKNIKYKGKSKTVEIISEYTHLNGKEYVMVKDINDNGKTKTLFREYIEWL